MKIFCVQILFFIILTSCSSKTIAVDKNIATSERKLIRKTPIDSSKIKIIILDTISQSYIKTYGGSLSGYGNKSFFHRAQSFMRVINTNNIVFNNDFIFLTCGFNDSQNLKIADKYICPLDKKENHMFLRVIAINPIKNIVLYFEEYGSRGKKNKYPLRLMNLKTKQQQKIKIAIEEENQFLSTKLEDKKIIIEYLNKENIIKMDEIIILI